MKFIGIGVQVAWIVFFFFLENVKQIEGLSLNLILFLVGLSKLHKLVWMFVKHDGALEIFHNKLLQFTHHSKKVGAISILYLAKWDEDYVSLYLNIPWRFWNMSHISVNTNYTKLVYKCRCWILACFRKKTELDNYSELYIFILDEVD